MPWDLNLDHDRKIVRITYAGLVTPAELKDSLIATVSVSKKNGILHYLTDCSGMVGGHSATDLYFLISLFESVGIDREAKEALILPHLQSTVKEVEFYETACINRGYSVKIFRNAEEALVWLKS
jgi:hypothetical protein